MIQWLISLPRNAKRLVGVGTDVILLPFVLWLSFCLRLDQLYVPDVRVATVAALTTLATGALFVRLGLYRAVIRFAGTQVLTSIFIGISFSALALAFFGFLLQAPIPRSVPFIYFGLSVIAVGGTRLVMRSFLTSGIRHQSDRVIIYGAGSAGVQLATALSQGIEYRPVAFIDDDDRKHGTILQDLRVYKPNRLNRLIDQKQVKHIFLAISSLGNSQRARVLKFLTGYKISVKIIPSYADIATGRANISELRDVEVEDLLGRDTVEPRADLLAQAIRGRTVMITGAGGSIGSELCRQIQRLSPKKLVLFESSEFALYTITQELKKESEVDVIPILGTVRDRHHLTRTMEAHTIEVVYHAAAYKHVPIVEENELSGVSNNILGTWNTTCAALETNVADFILISTDKAVRPTNVMGASKRMAELILQAHASNGSRTNFSMVRFGNVLNSSGSVVPLFRDQIRSGGPVTVTHKDVTRYFMTIPEAVQLVIQASAMSQGGDVFVLDMNQPVKIAELARTMVNLMGETVRDDENPDGTIEISYTGLRPGEKLYEELLIGDNCVGSEHPMINRAMEDHIDYATLRQIVDGFAEDCQTQNLTSAVARLEQWVYGYRNSHSTEEAELIDFDTHRVSK
ncbi:MAG: nucleoside-diphosphate sugar epimerase/dehydratase [Pseudomonadota bacterium]